MAQSPQTSNLRATSWTEVVRLRTLPAAVAPVILGTGGAIALGQWSWLRALLAAVVALLLQIGSNIANDYSDGVRGTDDDRTGPPRLTASGQIAPGTVKMMALACFALAGLFGLALLAISGAWWMLLLGLAAVAAAWFYTGGAHPYGYLGLGEIFVFVFFGLMATAGTTYVQAYRVPGWLWLCASGIGLIACSLLMVNNLRDIHTDPAHGKMTLAVRLGQTRARMAFVLLLTLPLLLGMGALVWLVSDDNASLSTAKILVGLVFVGVMTALIDRTIKPVYAGAQGKDLIPVLRNAGLTELVYGVMLAFCLVIWAQ